MASALDILKKNLGLPVPGTDVVVSRNVMENLPSLSLDTPHTAYEADANERMKQMLGLGPSPLIQQQQKDLTAQDEAINQARIAANPEVSAEADKAMQEKLALAHAQPGGLDVETAKNTAAAAAQAAKMKQVQDLIGGQNQGAGGETWKPSINAQGDVSFTQTGMPALVQRAHAQLSDARNKTISTLQEAERLYPGITAEAAKVDAGGQAPSWTSFITGGAGKYGGAMDLAGAANDRLKYSMGIPTPFANLAQAASFGNLEQMAGQLPGVRGLATITPLFKEHQSRWGRETPLATVQRLLHMKSIMEDSLSNMEHGGANEPTGMSVDPWSQPPTTEELAGAR